DQGLGALVRLHVAGGEAGDTAEVLEEVERHALGAEHRPRRAEETGDDLVLLVLLALLGLGVELQTLVDELEDAPDDGEAGDDAILLADHLAATGHLRGEDRVEI